MNSLIMEILSGPGREGAWGQRAFPTSLSVTGRYWDRQCTGERARLVYHAVLNLGEGTDVFERYLRHPRREPDYRQGRLHSEFVTSLEGGGV
ncbi:MAG: hypothetical protein MZV63_56820 [Marinilabiliales bacterium]|nr:hypothetical protein [Marinilabiliales bacterium]